MIKRFASALTAVFILLLFSSCGKSGGASYIDLSLFGDDFRASNTEMFLNENCEHLIEYKPLTAALSDDDANIYHYVCCHWGKCDYKAHTEPHIIIKSEIIISEGTELKENLCYYHSVYCVCRECGKTFYLYILCEKQDRNCKPKESGCLQNADWRDILCDTPYGISDD